MSYQPTSLEEAKTHRYGKWAGLPNGNAYDPSRCACHIMTGGRGSLPTQCRSKPGHGPDGIYCKTHALENFPKAVGTWYKAGGYGDGITPVQVASFSESTVTIMAGNSSRRVSQKGNDERYFPTFEAAKAWMIARFEKRLRAAEANASEYRKTLEELRNLSTPDHSPLNHE